MKYCKYTFAVLLLCIMTVFSVPIVHAQETEEQDASEVTAVTQGQAPIVLTLDSVSVNNDTSEIEVDLSVLNSKEEFVQSLDYTIELYRGDRLNTSGYLFEGLELVYIEEGLFEGLAPNESRQELITFNYPRSIESGNYYLRITAYNPEITSFGLAFTDTPLALQGSGDFLSFPDAQIMDNDGIHNMLHGNSVSLTQDQTILFAYEDNAGLASRYQNGEEFFLSVRVENIAFNGATVHQYDPVQLSPINVGGTNYLGATFEPWEDIVSGSYTLYVTIVDEAGNLLADEIHGRWLVEGGLVRVRDVHSATNRYSKDTPIDLSVDIVYAGSDEEGEYTLRAEFFNASGETVVKEQKFTVPGSITSQVTNITFDEVFGDKMTVKKIRAAVIDSSNSVLSEYILDMPTNEIFSSEKFVSLYAIVSIVVLLVVFLVGLVILRKKGDKNVAAVAIIVFALLVSGVIGYENVSSQGASAESTYDCTGFDCTSTFDVGDPGEPEDHDHSLDRCYRVDAGNGAAHEYEWRPEEQGERVDPTTWQWRADGQVVGNSQVLEEGFGDNFGSVTLNMTEDDGTSHSITCDAPDDDPGPGATTTINIFENQISQGNLGLCPVTTSVTYTAIAACTGCMNALDGIIQIEANDGGANWTVAAEVVNDDHTDHTSAMVIGPITHQFELSEQSSSVSYRGRARTYRAGNFANMCEPSEWVYTQTRYIECTVDVCPNINGEQTEVPAGHLLINGQCVQNLDASCYAADKDGNEFTDDPAVGEPILWIGLPEPTPSRPLQFTWGADASGNDRVVSATYGAVGEYTASIQVTDSTDPSSYDDATCTVNVVDEIGVSCSANPILVEPGEDVTWQATAYNSSGPVTYSWSGAVNGAGSAITTSYENEGRFTAVVTATDESTGNYDTAQCVVTVDEPQDMCPNLGGYQDYVPYPYYINPVDGHCIVDDGDDLCLNIPGDQAQVPAGLVRDQNGNCLLDLCWNLPGIQQAVPAGHFWFNFLCLPVNFPRDMCPNLPGDQEEVPLGYYLDTFGDCVPFGGIVTDACTNIDGVQNEIPTGRYRDPSTGACYVPDMCVNIDGIQIEVPDGYTQDITTFICTADGDPTTPTDAGDPGINFDSNEISEI